MYKAIFFDRDNTITYYNPEKLRWRNDIIESWSGKPFDLPYEKMMVLFQRSAEGKTPWYKNVDDEREFCEQYYRNLLIHEDITEPHYLRKESQRKKAYMSMIMLSKLTVQENRVLPLF